MAINDATIAAYAPWGNAVLAFEVSGSDLAIDPETGNPEPEVEVLEYLAALSLAPARWEGQEGADMSTYQCNGRLLHPPAFDARITNGSHATASINGYIGRLEVTHDLQMDQAVVPTLRQAVRGTFRVIGGAPIPTP